MSYFVINKQKLNISIIKQNGICLIINKHNLKFFDYSFVFYYNSNSIYSPFINKYLLHSDNEKAKITFSLFY
jgi:hypothetical protein